MTFTRRHSFAFALAAYQPELPPADDWQNIGRVVAIGDIHGDKDAFVATLRMAGLLDAGENWSGGNAHLVQIGDIPARGTQVRECFDFIIRLEQQAAAAGGRVHTLIGNHDAGVIHGDLRGTLPEEFAAFREPSSEQRLEQAFAAEIEARKRAGRLPSDQAELDYLRKSWFQSHPPGWVEHRQAFSPTGRYGAWIRRNNTIIRINDSLFVHGGISPKYVRASRASINQAIRRELADPARRLPGMATEIQGPLWYRGFAEEDGPAIEAHLSAVLRYHRVRRIIFGHTVTRSAILPLFGARAVNLDLGLSRFYGRPPACLVLEGNDAFVLHRGVRVPLPGPGPAAFLAYLKAIEEADEKPSPVTALIAKQAGDN